MLIFRRGLTGPVFVSHKGADLNKGFINTINAFHQGANLKVVSAENETFAFHQGADLNIDKVWSSKNVYCVFSSGRII